MFTNTIALLPTCGKISLVSAAFLSIFTYYWFTAQSKFCAPLSPPDKCQLLLGNGHSARDRGVPVSPTTEVPEGESGISSHRLLLFFGQISLLSKHRDTRMGLFIPSSLLVTDQWQTPGVMAINKDILYVCQGLATQLCNREGPTASSACRHMHRDRTAVTNTYLSTNVLTTDQAWAPHSGYALETRNCSLPA